MAKREIDKLTIALSPTTTHTIPVESILIVLKESVAILKELDRNNTLELSVSGASFNSPLTFNFVAETELPEYDAFAMDEFLGVIRHVVEKTPLPKRAGRSGSHVVAKARRLTKVLDTGVAKIELITPRETVVVTKTPIDPKKATPIEEIDYEDFIELEGSLELASRHDGKRFVIWDRVTNHKTTCNVPPEFFIQALDALKSDETPRVSVYGKAQYRKGLPVSIDVEDFRILPSLSQAIDPSFFQGINITDGIDSAEYLRSMMGDA